MNGNPVAAGERNGALTALALLPERGPRGQIIWQVRCDCGKEFPCRSGNFRRGQRQCMECGRAITVAARLKHGDAGPVKANGYRRPARLYSTWMKMRRRCGNPKATQYRWYGAKGIKVCEEWLDYPAFKAWALSHGYADDLTIERVRSSGNYEPDNCEWITQSENSRRARAASVSHRQQTALAEALLGA